MKRIMHSLQPLSSFNKYKKINTEKGRLSLEMEIKPRWQVLQLNHMPQYTRAED
jgi:hypothetical protein